MVPPKAKNADGRFLLDVLKVVHLPFSIPLLDGAKTTGADENSLNLSSCRVLEALLLQVHVLLPLRASLGVAHVVSCQCLLSGHKTRFWHSSRQLSMGGI